MTPEKRLEVCKNCEWFRKVISQCKKCGCIMPIKVKIKSSTCPLKKW